MKLPADHTTLPPALARQWQQALSELHKPEPIPPGWITRDQLSQLLHESKDTTKRKIHALRQSNKIESRMIRNSPTSRIAIYHLKP